MICENVNEKSKRRELSRGERIGNPSKVKVGDRDARGLLHERATGATHS